MCLEFWMRKLLRMSGQKSISPFKVYSFRGITLEWGIETECADSVNVAKPQIEAPLKTDRSYYYTEGEGGFLIILRRFLCVIQSFSNHSCLK